MKLLFSPLLLIIFLQFSCVSNNSETLVYIGTYTRGSSEGIYVSKMNAETGELSKPMLAAKFKNPSFVAVHPNKKYFYAVAEERGDSAIVAAFKIEADGMLTKINQSSSLGDIPCHLIVDETGKTLLVANYGGKTCSSFKLGDDGSIGKGMAYHHTGRSITKRQSQPNPHSINTDIANKRAFVADLGIDKIVIYDINHSNSTLKKSSEIKMPAGGGPRHFSFHPSGKFAYSNLEITRQIVAMAYDQKSGTLKQMQVLSTVPGGVDKGSTAECLVHPNGKWVYVSNRGHNSIAVFEIDQSSGQLKRVQIELTGGNIPRGFGIHPSGKFLVVGHHKGTEVNVFKIDQSTGKLSFTGNTVSVDQAVNVRFLVR